MPTFKVTAPDGRKLKITGDAMPTEAELDEIFKSVGKPTQQDNSVNVASARLGLPGSGGFEALKTFGSSAAEMLNPVAAAKSIYGMITDPMANVIAPMMREKVKADEAARTGQRVDNLNPMGHEIAGAIPIVGPAAAQVVDTMMKDPARGFGQLAGVYAGGKIMEAAPKVIPGAVQAVVPPVKAAVGAIADTAVPEMVAGTVGGALGGFHGAGAAVTAVELMRAAPKVWRAVKESIQKSKGVSGAEAEASMLKMTPEQIQEIAAPKVVPPTEVSLRDAYKAKVMEGVEAQRKAYWDAHPKPVGSAPSQPTSVPKPETGQWQGPFQELTPEQLANVDAQLAPGGKYGPGLSNSDIKPIPPSKLPVRLPDPEVPELTMRERSVQKFEQAKAARQAPKGDVVEAPPAFPGQQGAKGATKDRFREIAARNVKSMIEAGNKDAFIISKLRSVFKMSDEDAEALVREVSGKGKN